MATSWGCIFHGAKSQTHALKSRSRCWNWLSSQLQEKFQNRLVSLIYWKVEIFNVCGIIERGFPQWMIKLYLKINQKTTNKSIRIQEITTGFLPVLTLVPHFSILLSPSSVHVSRFYEIFQSLDQLRHFKTFWRALRFINVTTSSCTYIDICIRWRGQIFLSWTGLNGKTD